MKPNPPAPVPPLDRVDPPLLRWTMRAVLLGLLVGVAAGIAALRAG